MSPEQKKKLLILAREVLENNLLNANHDLNRFDTDDFQDSGGVFVTLNKNGNLRGCIGRIESEWSLFKNVVDLTKAAAFNDHRFNRVIPEELPHLTIEISFLTKSQKLEGVSTIDKIDKIRPKKDGVVIEANGKQATFLPQVWDALPIKEDFIGDLCRKAGLPRNYWQSNDMEISVYQVEKTSEEADQ